MNACSGSLFRLPNNAVCCLVTLRDERALMDDAPSLTAEVRKSHHEWISKIDCLNQLLMYWKIIYSQHHQVCLPFTLIVTARTCVEGLCRSENSRGPAQAPAERRGHKPRRVVTAAAARHFLDVLHVLWKKTSMSASNLKSTALYQSMKECE